MSTRNDLPSLLSAPERLLMDAIRRLNEDVIAATRRERLYLYVGLPLAVLFGAAATALVRGGCS